MSEVYLYCLIKNCVCVICLTILAIIFSKWWIILFAPLFFSFVEYKKEEKSND